MPRTFSARAVIAALCGLALLAAACELEESTPEPGGSTTTSTTTTAPPATTTTAAPTTTAPPATTTTAPPATTTTTAPPADPTPPPPPPQMGGMPHVNADLIPTGSPGHSTIRVRSRTDSLGQPSQGSGDGAFRNICTFSHMNFDDPLVFPGQPNSTHLHAFFGNTNIDHSSNTQSIAASGNSTCRGGIINRSAYWVPAIIDTRDGRPIEPSELGVYYKSGWHHAPDEIQAHPAGLRMIAGNASSTTAQHNVVEYECGLGGPSSHHIPAGCGSEINMKVSFPQCWDGVNLDSADHRSHMAYPSGQCPDSHPVPLPHITFNVLFPVQPGDDTGSWRLSSDMYSTDEPGGYSGHADWWDGWMPEFRDEWTEHCTTKHVSCHSHLLGPGREIY